MAYKYKHFSSNVKAEQEKSVTITENGTTEINPDSGKTISKATVVVNIPEKVLREKNVTPTTSRQVVLPYDGDYGLSKVTVEAIPSTYITTTDATATASDILSGKTAYAKGEKLTGTIETYTGDGGETVSKLAALADGSLTEITAEDLAGATKLIDYAFFFSTLTSITIPNSVISIGHFAFKGSTLLTSVIISNSVTKIGSNAFERCSKLTSITIPDSVTTIGGNALAIGSSTNKATITMLPTTPPTIQSNTFDASYLEKIIVPAGTGATYKAATNWSNFADYIEEAAV